MIKFTAKGTFTALVTPFLIKKDKHEIDFNSLKKLIDFQIEGGVEGIVILGSTGEGSLISEKERIAVIEQSVIHADNKIPVIVGIGAIDTEIAYHWASIAHVHGASAVLVSAPSYVKPSQKGIYEHFRFIADNVKIPVIMYNVPSRTGVNMTVETQLKLATEFSNIVATKEASANLDQIMSIINQAPKDFNVLAGDDAWALPVIAAGGKGVVSVISNYAPKPFSDMVRNALAGKIKLAQETHYKLFELMNLDFCEPNPVPVKTALSLMGKIKNVVRLPMMEIEEDNKKKIKDAIKKAGLK